MIIFLINNTTIFLQQLINRKEKAQVRTLNLYYHINLASYFSLPKEMNNSVKGFLNIQSKDNEYCNLCLVRYVNPVDKNLCKN